MIGRRKKRSSLPPNTPADLAAAATRSNDAAAVPPFGKSSPEPASGETPAGRAPDAARPQPAAKISAKPGPGRPPKAARCLRCARRVERCHCKEGALLSKDVQRAIDRDKSAPAKPMDRAQAEQLLRMALFILGIAESGIAAVVSSLTWDEAQQIWSYNEKEVEILLPATHKVLAKYAHKLPDFLTRFSDEIALGFVFMQVTQAKANRSAAAIAQKHARKESEKPRPLALVPRPAASAEAAPAASEAKPAEASI